MMRSSDPTYSLSHLVQHDQLGGEHVGHPLDDHRGQVM